MTDIHKFEQNVPTPNVAPPAADGSHEKITLPPHGGEPITQAPGYTANTPLATVAGELKVGEPHTVNDMPPKLDERGWFQKTKNRVFVGVGVVAAAAVAAVAIGGNSGKAESDKHAAPKPGATSTPTAGQKATSGAAKPTASESASTLPSTGAEHAHTGLDITDTANLPADVPTETIQVRNWEVKFPTTLGNPATDPELYGTEVLLAEEVLGSAPIDSPAFYTALDLLGHTNHTDKFSNDSRTLNQGVQDSTKPFTSDPAQLIYFSPDHINVTHDATSGVTTFTAPDGTSVWRAADAFTGDEWQADAAKQAGEDPRVFPNYHLAKLATRSHVGPDNKVVVDGIDVGAPTD